MGLFKKVYKLTAEQYGYLISKFIFSSAKNTYSSIRDTFCSSNDESLCFYELLIHYTYICECLLKEKYRSEKVDKCIIYAVEGFAISMGVSDKSVEKITISFLEMYDDISSGNYNIFTEDGLHQLVQSYQDCFENNHDMLGHLTIFSCFSGFIIHHSVDIAGDHLVLI